MAATDPRTYLWENICRLAGIDPSAGINATEEKVPVGRGNVQAIKERERSVGIATLMRFADVFGLEVWQLLTPDLQPGEAPELAPPKHLRSVFDLSRPEGKLVGLFRQLGERSGPEAQEQLLAALSRRLEAANESHPAPLGPPEESKERRSRR